MNRYPLIALLVLVCLPGYGQSAGQNYILTQTYTSPTAHNDAIRYFDGLGRPVETVLKQFTPSGKDLVSRTEYDAFGREARNWLPAPNSKSDGTWNGETSGTTCYADSYPYSETLYEPSPLNRVREQYGPGAAWRSGSGHKTTTAYLANKLPTENANLACPNYSMDGIYAFRRNEYYAANQLFVTQTTDEDGNLLYEFRDKLGQLLLQRLLKGGTCYDTNYIYDDFGNLALVFPPVVSDFFTANGTFSFFDEAHRVFMSRHAYFYFYNHRGQLTGKGQPGIGPHDFAWDRAGRLIMESNPEREVVFHKYDALGREILSGIYNYDTSNSQFFYNVQEGYKNQVLTESVSATGSYGYTWNVFPAEADVEVTQVNYYDNYTYAAAGDASLVYQTKTGYGAQHSSATGLLTGTRTKLLDGSGWIRTTFFYDTRGNLVQQRSTNHKGGYDHEYYAYNYNNLATKKFTEHSVAGQSGFLTEEYDYEYDAQLRLKAVKHKLNGGTQTGLAEYEYNDLGQVRQKKTGGQETAMLTYNLRGWPTATAGTRFTENLYYTSSPKSGGTAYYGGNVSALTWKSSPDVSVTRGYSFQYDALGMLTAASYGEGSALNTNTQRYDESFTCDKHGNILTLQRRGLLDNNSFGLIDNLTMTEYQGNMLRTVSETVPNQAASDLMEFKVRTDPLDDKHYFYYSSGALMADYHRRICMIKYNYLTLPKSVQFTRGDRIEYLYGADGIKRQTKHKEANRKLNYSYWNLSEPAASDILRTTVTDYAGNRIYVDNALKYILTEEGYIEKTGGGYSYFYYLKDRLGGIRIVMNATGGVVQATNYYPSGVTMAELPRRTDQGVQRYKFGGKELDRSYGLDAYDFEARPYNPVLMRFTGFDPLASKYPAISPYAYCANNPVNAVDLHGDSIWYTKDKNVITMHVTGKVINNSGDNINVSRAAKDIATGINDAFSGKFEMDGTAYTLQTDIQLEAVESMDGVADSDHLFVLADADGKSARGATSMDGGKVMTVYAGDYANDNWLSNNLSWSNTRSAVHEFGHAAGLGHETASGRRNLMTQSGGGTNITSKQRTIIWKRQNTINNGPNSYFGKPYPYVHGYNRLTKLWEIDTAYRLLNFNSIYKR